MSVKIFLLLCYPISHPILLLLFLLQQKYKKKLKKRSNKKKTCTQHPSIHPYFHRLSDTKI